MIKAPLSCGSGPAERPGVLLADDHQAMLALTADALTNEFFVVGSVGEGRLLLAETERLHPDVIVLDITMPRLDGIEAARQLRSSQRPARLVFLAVHEDADYARAALDAGGLATLSRRGSLPISSPPHGRRLPIASSSHQTSNSMKRD